jgi:hypothetical protein
LLGPSERRSLDQRGGVSMHPKRLMAKVALVTVATLGLASPAFAAPVTFTEPEKFSESFSDSFLCQDELYQITVTGRTVTHLTARTDADGNIVPPLRFHFLVHAKVTAVPLDGTGPSYVGHFHTFDLETIRSVRHGDVIAETDTDHNKVVAKGSDGSRVRLQEHHHFTVNANGEVSIEFDKVKASC